MIVVRRNCLKLGMSLGLLTLLGGCAGAPGIAPPGKDAALVQGPPISDIVTPSMRL